VRGPAAQGATWACKMPRSPLSSGAWQGRVPATTPFRAARPCSPPLTGAWCWRPGTLRPRKPRPPWSTFAALTGIPFAPASGGAGTVPRTPRTSRRNSSRGCCPSRRWARCTRPEAAATAALQHPNIVAIHEVGFCAGQHFLVMDFVEGPSLAKVISDLRFQISDFRRSVRWTKATWAALWNCSTGTGPLENPKSEIGNPK